MITNTFASPSQPALWCNDHGVAIPVFSPGKVHAFPRESELRWDVMAKEGEAVAVARGVRARPVQEHGVEQHNSACCAGDCNTHAHACTTRTHAHTHTHTHAHTHTHTHRERERERERDRQTDTQRDRQTNTQTETHAHTHTHTHTHRQTDRQTDTQTRTDTRTKVTIA